MLLDLKYLFRNLYGIKHFLLRVQVSNIFSKEHKTGHTMRRTVEVSLISFAIGIFLPFATSESLFLSDEMIANTNFDDSISSRSAGIAL